MTWLIVQTWWQHLKDRLGEEMKMEFWSIEEQYMLRLVLKWMDKIERGEWPRE